MAMHDRETGRMRGFGQEEADAAISQWNEQQLDGRTIRVNPADSVRAVEAEATAAAEAVIMINPVSLPFRRSTCTYLFFFSSGGRYGGDSNNSSGSLW
ncbi:hypothetical protein B0H19DRAFT_1255639 [Mycena capillaripes]|nr:hypothetical protein B0H19DRAFT_1255639 [Mycena capillaripes]